MIRILCVDDEPTVLHYLAARLGMEADLHVVDAVADAGAAFACLRQKEIDVVVLDYRLGGADGLQLLQALWIWHDDIPERQRPKILFCTGLADEVLEDKAAGRGAAGVVSKAEVARELVPAVRAVAGGARWFQFDGSAAQLAPCGTRR